ncbi:G-protein coupled receptor moody-like [Tachypleus tridentatus]|uniref:G-protein coupled receptor moody-like n=1 Tax=Tachypleus tridentatus TaxID=6853 RepID=UPI003FD40983
MEINVPTILNDTDICNKSVSTMSPVNNFNIVLYFATCLIIFFGIVGLCGNLLTIVALVKSSQIRGSTTAAFIVSLSVVDFLYYIISLPFTASDYILQRWIYGDVLCVFYPFMQYFTCGLSLLSVTAISINRYVLIAHQNLYNNIYNKQGTAAIIIGYWLFAFIILFPTLIGKWGRFGYDEKIFTCTILEVDGRSAKSFVFGLAFFIPCVAIVICYARIFWVVRKSSRRMKMHSNLNITEDTKGSDAKKREQEWRMTKMVLIIFCTFLICNLPITIVKVTDKQNNCLILQVFVSILVYANSSINPIIYVVINKQYRQAYINLFH